MPTRNNKKSIKRGRAESIMETALILKLKNYKNTCTQLQCRLQSLCRT